MRALSERSVRRCEEAIGHVCKCRCGGTLHGSSRGGPDPGREFYEKLDTEDPHFLPSQTLLRLKRNERRRQHREEVKRLRFEELAKLQGKLFDPEEYKQAPNFGW